MVKTDSMLDSGATGKGFIDESFAHHNKFTFHKLRNRRRLNVVDGRPSSAGDITHVVKLNMEIKGHKEKMLFYVTKLGKYDIILGKPWLGWVPRTVTESLLSPYCHTDAVRCLILLLLLTHLSSSLTPSVIFLGLRNRRIPVNGLQKHALYSSS